jgi:DNA-binding transcriptional LysR family regulator
MDLELRQLRCLVAIVDTGTFTDAAIELGVSQAAVSRTLSALERVLGVRLLHRTSRSITPTTAGVQVLARARQLLAEADNLVREATTGHTRLLFVRTNTPTGGLAEGLCDLAIVRTPIDRRRYSHATVGSEPRYCVMAADDPWAKRRSITLAEIAERVLMVDRRTGTTTADLWPPEHRPKLVPTNDVDDWLAAIAAGRCVGITPQATVTQYRRDGIVYRRVRDAPPVPVHLIWRRHDPHPATHAAIALLTELYSPGSAH